MDLTELIKDVLNFHGFVIEDGGIPIRARRGGEEYVVVVVKKPEEKEIVEHMEVGGKVLVISLGDWIDRIGDEFWDRKTFERMVGRMVVSKIMETGKESWGNIIDSFESAFAEHREPVASPRSSEYFESEVKDAFSSTQELHPFYAYYFDIDDSEYTESGILLVSAIEERVSRAADRITCDMGALSSVQRMEPKINEEEALDAARDFLMKEHTREEDVVKEEGTITVMEKRLVGIDKENINLKFLGMLHIPFLKVEKSDGLRTLDMSGIVR